MNTSYISCEDAWLLDTEATCHMSFKRDFFEDLNENIDGAACFADKSNIKPFGIKSFRLKLIGCPNFLLNDVLYLPELQQNLLSLVLVRQQGHSIHMFNGKVEIKRSYGNQIVMFGLEDEKLLKLKSTSIRSKFFAFLAYQDKGTLPSSHLWHARFGHLNFDELHLLKQNGFFGLPIIPRNVEAYATCVLGKHCKQPFLYSQWRASRKLELIHSDICGPFLVSFVVDNRCLMTFIDDYSRMFWVYLLKHKFDAVSKFKEFHTSVENETCIRLGIFHSDNEGEYTFAEFTSYLHQHGIKH